MQFLVKFHKRGIARPFQVLVGYASVQKGMRRAPVALSGDGPLPCLPFGYATALQVLEACPHTFPAFPYTHAYAAAKPFVCFPQKTAHLGKPKVVHSHSDCIGQFLLALTVSPAVDS